MITHRLNIDPSVRPIQQKRRAYDKIRLEAMKSEVKKLLEAGVIRELQYPTWLCNPVMVPKPNGDWRMCQDFTDLNKACPKDCYQLPLLDKLVDATAGHSLLCFLDAFSGYHQIFMHPRDAEKTAFVTPIGMFYYTRMPFGLKSAGSTYQRLVNSVFQNQIGRNMEVYIDDMVIKSEQKNTLLQDIQETFASLRRFNMKLNPKKCTFGVPSGKFLGFMISQRGIEANPDKIQAIIDMKPPSNVREVQRLNGRVAALGRFISRTGERCLPFFKIIRKTVNFEWTQACQQAFEDLKSYLRSPPLISVPRALETLYLYLSVTDFSVSIVLVRNDSEIERPIYYVSRVLHDAELRYTRLEKFALALVTAARRLRAYFQAHPIVVLTDQPLRQILQKPDLSGRLAKWSIELGEFDIQYQPRRAIKAQALADFIAESTPSPENKEREKVEEQAWKVYVDGSSNRTGGGAGLIISGPRDFHLAYALRFNFKASNNEAEYEALITALKLAKTLQVHHLSVYSDSQLIVKQVNGEFEARDLRMSKYLTVVKSLLCDFTDFQIIYIPREENSQADALSKVASADFPNLARQVLLEVLEAPSIEAQIETAPIERLPEESWMTPIWNYLQTGVLPHDPLEARRIEFRSNRYLIRDRVLYKKAFSGPLLKCLDPIRGHQVLLEVHAGACGNHLGARSLAYKVLRQGYFWPTLKKDSAELVKKCRECQFFSRISHSPATIMTPINSPVPFDQWGIDLVTDLPAATGNRRWLIVAVDYFTKWVEAEPLGSITQEQVIKFIWKNLICRFGLPRSIVTDNGTQFTGGLTEDFLSKYHIQHKLSSVSHPQTNGQAEVTNRTIIQSIKTRLLQTGKRWVDELPSVLWAYRTTRRIPTGETPFALTYGAEALIPIEVLEESARVHLYNEESNSEVLAAEKDLLEETREASAIRNAYYKQVISRYHNKQVKERLFQVGDLILRKVESTGKHVKKLAPNWEGPFRIRQIVCPGTYRLDELDGRHVPRCWNSEHLRKFYQ